MITFTEVAEFFVGSPESFEINGSAYESKILHVRKLRNRLLLSTPLALRFESGTNGNCKLERVGFF